MICVSIGRGRHKHMVAEHRHLVEEGAQLVELRLDYIDREVSLSRLLANRPCPVIITVRRETDGGKWKGDEESRLMLLRMAIAEGAEYVDLEEDIAHKIPRFGSTKRIISLHDFNATPNDLDKIHSRLRSLDADVIKLATMAHSPHDNTRMLQLMAQAETPTVGMCMGEIGTPSRLLAGRFGAPFTYSTFHHERTLAPGQLSFRQMKEIYRYDETNEQTDVFGVIADPVGHSLSPIIHNAAFAHDKANCLYAPFRIPAEYLDTFMEDCQTLGLRGLSVTIPHKEAVVRNCTQIDKATQLIGAANTILFKDGAVLGYNTDYRAAMESLERVTSGSNEETLLSGHVALLLGAGGAARALAFGLKSRGAAVVVASRSRDKADALAKRVDGRAVEWGQRHTIKADILVNATPIGMHPNVDSTPYDMHYMRPGSIVFELVYNPEQTLLVKEAKQRGCRIVSGVDMFIGQASLQYKLFTGREAPQNVMRAAFKRAIGPAKS